MRASPETTTALALALLACDETTVNVKAVTPPWSTPGLYRMKPKDLANSLVYTLPDAPTTVTNGQMPPLATHQVDATGVGHVQAWIEGLP
jgi:hypothetical protein